MPFDGPIKKRTSFEVDMVRGRRCFDAINNGGEVLEMNVSEFFGFQHRQKMLGQYSFAFIADVT